ncbi:MAG TPA: hypothetical protein VM285_16435 [Polyangia bacterium]|nr:hypothetical protein [Polyangia bacterium]
MKTLLVGEMNPYGADPAFALYPLPEHASGGRLARILGLHPREYLRTFDRVNLCTGKWSMRTARGEANRLNTLQESGRWDHMVLLGRKVCDAFCVRYEPFTSCGSYLVLPHPSGRCRAWSEAGAAERARALVLGGSS